MITFPLLDSSWNIRQFIAIVIYFIIHKSFFTWIFFRVALTDADPDLLEIALTEATEALLKVALTKGVRPENLKVALTRVNSEIKPLPQICIFQTLYICNQMLKT